MPKTPTARTARLATLATALVLLAGCAGQPPQPDRGPAQEPPARPAPAPRHSGARGVVARTAREMLGTPYRYGGESPRGFDCSGLVRFSYAHAGIEVPRTTRQQFRSARHISLDRLQPGDLLFFRIDGRAVSHVGIYLGDGRFVHAPSGGKRVAATSLSNPYWRTRLAGAGHYFY